MLKNKFYSKLLVAGITGTLIISTSLIAFASSSKPTTTPKTNISAKSFGGPQGQKGDMQRGNPLASVLKAQVTAGVITQAESNKVTAYLKTKEAAKKAEMIAQKAKLDAMTDAQREAYMKANIPAQENIFADLVTADILTQTQVDKIKASMPQRPQNEEFNGQKPAVSTTTSASVTK